MRLFLLLLLSLASLKAQTNVSAFQPQYFVGTGVSFDHYGKTGFAASTEFAANACFLTNSCATTGLSKVYSFTTIELTAAQAILRTGAAYMFYQSGYWVLIGLGDAGLATGSGPTLGAFSTGGFLAYDIGGKISKGASHFYVAFGGRVISISSQTVQPIATFILGKAF